VSVTWKDDPAGQAAIRNQLAMGLHNFALDVRDGVRQAAPQHTSKRPVAYRNTIQASTFLDGNVIAGSDVTNAHSSVQLHSVVYTSSSLGPLLERGAVPHDIWIPTGGAGILRVWHHPGFSARHHFFPGLMSALGGIASAFLRGKANTRFM